MQQSSAITQSDFLLTMEPCQLSTAQGLTVSKP